MCLMRTWEAGSKKDLVFIRNPFIPARRIHTTRLQAGGQRVEKHNPKPKKPIQACNGDTPKAEVVLGLPRPQTTEHPRKSNLQTIHKHAQTS